MSKPHKEKERKEKGYPPLYVNVNRMFIKPTELLKSKKFRELVYKLTKTC